MPAKNSWFERYAGVIHPNYRVEVQALVTYLTDREVTIRVGQRCVCLASERAERIEVPPVAEIDALNLVFSSDSDSEEESRDADRIYEAKKTR